MSRQPPLSPATTDTIARELIAAWPGWVELCRLMAHLQDDPEDSVKWLFNTVEQFVSQAVCRVAGHDHPVFLKPGGLKPDMHCSHCGENLG